MNAPSHKAGAAAGADERRKQPLASAVETALTRYLKDLDGDRPSDLSWGKMNHIQWLRLRPSRNS